MLTSLSPRRPSGTRWCPTPTGDAGVDRPATGHHRDLTAPTAAVRGELDRAVRTVKATLGMTGKQPCKA